MKTTRGRLLVILYMALVALCAVFVSSARQHIPESRLDLHENVPQRSLLSKALDKKTLAYQLSESLTYRKKSLPRKNTKLENVPNEVQFNMDYVESIALIAVPGFVLSVLFLLYSVSMAIFTYCCPTCCAPSTAGYSSAEVARKRRKVYFAMSLNSLVILFFCIVVFANAPYFSSGVQDVIDTVSETVETTVDVISDVDTAATQLAQDIPIRMDQIVANLSDVEVLLAQINTLETQLEDAESQINVLNTDLSNLSLPPSGSLPETESAIESAKKSASESAQIINDLQSLAASLESQVVTIYDDMVNTIESKKTEIDQITQDIITQLDDVLEKAQDIDQDVDDEAEKASTYQNINAQGTAAFFVIPFLGCVFVGLGLYFDNKPLTIMSFVFLSISGIILWILVGVYLPAGVLMTDYCEEPYVILDEGLDYIGGDPETAIRGCFNRQSIFVSLGYEDELQVSSYFDYDSYVDDYFAFRDAYDIEELRSFVEEVSKLCNYNLLADVPLITPEAYGFNESSIQTGIDEINAITQPCCDATYSVSNISSLDPQTLPGVPTPEIRDELASMQQEVEALIYQNATIYEEINELTTNLTAIQSSINQLNQTAGDITTNFDDMEETLEKIDASVIGVEVVTNQTQADIDNIEELCDCSYVADSYDDFVDATCVTTISGVDVIWLSAITIAGGMMTHLAISRYVYQMIHQNREKGLYGDLS